MSDTSSTPEWAESVSSPGPEDESDPFNATLVEREDLTPELAVFRIAFEGEAVPDFTPGQYTTLGVVKPEHEVPEAVRRRRKGPMLIKRAYSIASSPKEKRYLEFYVVVVPEGKLTPRLWTLEAGDRLFMDQRIKGKFTLEDVPEGRDLVMVSTGTGLAPFVSMLRTYRRTDGGPSRWRKLVIVHGARLQDDLGYRHELERIAEQDESVVYIPACTREPDASNWSGLRGRVHAALEAEHFRRTVGVELSPETAHIFLCGNPAMIDQCEAELQQRGFSVRGRENPHGNIHFERYW